MNVLNNKERKRLIAIAERTIVDCPIGIDGVCELIRIGGSLSREGITSAFLKSLDPRCLYMALYPELNGV